MAIDTTSPRSRRALLAAAAGAAAATVVSAIDRPAQVRAGTDGDVVLGAANATTTTTTIQNTTNSSDVLHASGAGGAGIWATSGTYVAVFGRSAAADRPAIIGISTGASTGVQGFSGGSSGGPSSAKTGVYGYAAQDSEAIGVLGISTVGQGVRGEATSGIGVFGATTGPESTAVWGLASSPVGETYGLGGQVSSPAGIGMMSWHVGNGTAIAGYTGASDDTVTTRPNTAILGIASQNASTARGVVGVTTVGQGVRGEATTGVGGYFTATGTALQVAGKAAFSRSGRAPVPRGRVHVAAVRPNYPTAGKMRIYLNKALTAATNVAWVVLG